MAICGLAPSVALRPQGGNQEERPAAESTKKEQIYRVKPKLSLSEHVNQSEIYIRDYL